MKLHVDIESRSRCDLKKSGVYVYAADPSTEILCIAWALDDEPPQVWFPSRAAAPEELDAALADPTIQLVAHNADFERTMLSGPPGQRIGLLAPRTLERWDCTAARAAHMGLPRTLDGAGAALNLSNQKDKAGHALMMKMCKPIKRRAKKGDVAPLPGIVAPVEWIDDPASMERLGEYCIGDVVTERAIDKRIPNLPPDERQAWETTCRMNDRGVKVDETLLLDIATMLEDAEADVNAKLSGVTGGAVKRVSDHGALTRWLDSQGIDDALENGVGKAALTAYLERPDIDPVIRGALVLRRDGGKSSASKYKAITARLSANHRISGVLVYGGAASTLRWSSRGAQLHNLPRGGVVKDPLGAIRDICDGASLEEIEFLHGPPLVVASELLRPVFLAAPGCWMGRGDYSQIEARVIAWLAGAEWKLEAFRRYDAGTGPDAYKIAAAGIYQTTADAIASDDPRRQVGKVSELALGFEGGALALQAMAKGYGVKIPHFDIPFGSDGTPDYGVPAPDGTDEWIKRQWRAANPEIKALWKAMGDAAFDCANGEPGREVFAANGRIRFKRIREVMGMRLPSGRSLWYWNPRVVKGRFGWTVRYRSEDSQTKQWKEFDGYGGLFTQNAVQAIARDPMRDALIELERREIWPVLTVHDEAICEASRERFATPADMAAAIEEVMRQPPAWGLDIPLAADASAHERYIKGK